MRSTLAAVFRHRNLMQALTVQALRSRFAGSSLGVAWIVLQPIMAIAIYWFVFSVGFRVRPSNGAPFIVMFLCGFVPWSFFSETLLNNVHSVTSHSYLIKKTVFPSEILAFANLAASSVMHLTMLLILVVIMWASGLKIGIGALQLIYYFAALCLFSVGLGWICGAVNVFCRDLGPAVAILLNLWFWLTPIAWMVDMIPDRFMPYLRLNPLYHIVEGYRASLVGGVTLRNDAAPYFLAAVVSTFALGSWIFNRLKPEFPNAL